MKIKKYEESPYEIENKPKTMRDVLQKFNLAERINTDLSSPQRYRINPPVTSRPYFRVKK